MMCPSEVPLFVAETALKPAAVFRKQREDLIFVCLICFDPFEADTGDLNKGQRTFIFGHSAPTHP